MVAVVFGAAGLLALLGVLWISHRVLMAGGQGSGGSDAFGGLVEVFDPARARAEHDLDSRKHQGELVPAPTDDDRPVRVDLASGRATVRRRRP